MKNLLEKAAANSSPAAVKLLLSAVIRWPPGSYPSRMSCCISVNLEMFSFEENTLKNSNALGSASRSARVWTQNASIISTSFGVRTARYVSNSREKREGDEFTCVANGVQDIVGVADTRATDGKQIGHQKLHTAGIVWILLTKLFQSK